MSDEVKRYLIVRIERGLTESQKPVVEMYEDNPRLKYPSLRLFELHKLLDVGIDPNDMELGEERVVRFWAYYTESERLNQHGNPYQDVAYLEPIDSATAPAAVAGDDIVILLEELVAAVHAIAHDVALIRAHVGMDVELLAPETPHVTVERPPEQGPPPAAPPTPKPADEDLPLNEDQARRKFNRLVGPAVRDGHMPRELPSELATEVAAGAINWRDALARALKAMEETKAQAQWEQA